MVYIYIYIYITYPLHVPVYNMYHVYQVSEISETASDAWSTDVLASDTSERQADRLLELDQVGSHGYLDSLRLP